MCEKSVRSLEPLSYQNVSPFVGDIDSSGQPQDSPATPTLHPPDSIQRIEVEYASLTRSLVYLGKLKSSD